MNTFREHFIEVSRDDDAVDRHHDGQLPVTETHKKQKQKSKNGSNLAMEGIDIRFGFTLFIELAPASIEAYY